MKVKILIAVGILGVIAGIVLIGGFFKDKAQAIEAKAITKEQAIQIANATEEVREFLKLYPQANLMVFQSCCVPESGVFFAEKCKCIMRQTDPWVVAYSTDKYWDSPVSVRIAINSTSGEIFTKYPKLEYIKNKNYCEKDQDCAIHISGCACSNLIGKDYVRSGIVLETCNPEGLGLNCKCVNNICTAGK